MTRLAFVLLIALHLAGFLATSGSALAASRRSMSFVPGDRARPSGAARGAHRYTFARARHHGGGRVARRGQGRPVGHQGDDEGSAATARPGPGFTMENGVLTYPAPARFQPQNLKHLK